jgi:hypothetical protein
MAQGTAEITVDDLRALQLLGQLPEQLQMRVLEFSPGTNGNIKFSPLIYSIDAVETSPVEEEKSGCSFQPSGQRIEPLANPTVNLGREARGKMV